MLTFAILASFGMKEISQISQRNHQSIFAPKEKEVQWLNISGTILKQ
jgi:hypothetical protein